MALRVANMVLWSLVQLGLVPYLSWRIADQISDGALLVGPFLLISPMIAVAVAVMLFAVPYWRQQNEWPLSDSLAERANRFSMKLQTRPVHVAIYEDKASSTVANASESTVYVNSWHWEQLDWPARDFALARAVMSLARSSREEPLKKLTHAGVTLVAGVVASLNLWTILGLHVAMGVYIAAKARWWSARDTLRSDRDALRLTGDLTGATVFIRYEEGLREVPGLLSVDDRIGSLHLS